MNVLDTISGTRFKAFSAMSTFAVIYYRNIVYKVNRAAGTRSFALTASDTARLAFCHNVFTAAFGRARNVHRCRFWNAFYKTLGTSLNTKSARTAKLGIYVSVAVKTLYRHIRTGIYAASAAHATYFACFASAGKHILVDAVSVTLVSVLIVALTSAAASHDRNSRFCISDRKSVV